MPFLLAIQSAVGQGILWGIMALGVFITFRLLDIADLTVDGSFATGGAVCAVALTSGINPFVAILMATVSGFIAGGITGILHTKFDIPAILAGILSQIGLYSINLRIMGRSNIPLLNTPNLFKDFPIGGLSNNWIVLIIGLVIAVVIIMISYWFFGTELGSAIRATGNNEKMVRSLGVNTNSTKIIGLMISNGLIALSGGLVTQAQGYADIKMGIGAIVMALASIVIGEVLISNGTNFMVTLAAIISGSIIYRIIITLVLQAGLSTDDLKLFTAILVAVALAIPTYLAKRRQVTTYKKMTKELEDAETK